MQSNLTIRRLFKGSCAAALLLAAINWQPSAARAQTALMLPGAHSTTGIVINEPGSYYLPGNLTVHSGNAITIATNNVTLDLHGFTIASTAHSATGSGILLNGGLHNITILNGFIQSGVTNNGHGVYSGSGFQYGLYCPGANSFPGAPFNIRICGVSVAGVLSDGINLGYGCTTLVEACAVTTAGGFGIVASTIKTSTAMDCGSTAIMGDQLADCRGTSTGGYGVWATATALNCYGSTGAGGNYLTCAVAARTALNCHGEGESGYGVCATSAQNCSGRSESNVGVSATTAQNCSGQSESDAGVAAQTAQNCSGSSGTTSSSSKPGVAAQATLNCYGVSSGSGAGVYGASGFFGNSAALNCYGQSETGFGVSATTVQNCSGLSDEGAGLNADTMANSCYGISLSGTVGVSAPYGDFCFGFPSVSVPASHKYDMP